MDKFGICGLKSHGSLQGVHVRGCTLSLLGSFLHNCLIIQQIAVLRFLESMTLFSEFLTTL